MSEDQQKIVRDAVDKLGEHFCSVRIFVTQHDGGKAETQAYEYGSGNFYAQLGQIREWISVQDQYQRQYAKRKDEQNNQD